MIRNYQLFFLLLHSFSVCAQKPTEPGATDTLFSRLPDVTVVGRNSKTDYQQMPEIVGTNIYAGKKNALIVMDRVQGNLATNNKAMAAVNFTTTAILKER
jgi:Fe(3+) dicitrate transport protein